MRILDGPDLHRRIRDDPRWSQAQREAALKAARADNGARCVGMDAKFHPVLTVKLAGRPTEYALLRNGAPSKPVKPFTENWRPTRTGSTR